MKANLSLAFLFFNLIFRNSLLAEWGKLSGIEEIPIPYNVCYITKILDIILCPRLGVE